MEDCWLYLKACYTVTTIHYCILVDTARLLHCYTEIRKERSSDTCQYKIKYVLTFTKNDLTLVEISTGLDMYQIEVEIVGLKWKCLEITKCLTIITEQS